MSIVDLNQGSRYVAVSHRPNDDVRLSELMIVAGNHDAGWSLMSPIEIAAKELKAVSEWPLQAGTVVECAFSTTARRFICALNGTVHWCRKVKEQWQVGIFLESSIDSRIVTHNSQEVRSVLRYEIRHRGFIRTAPDAEPLPVTVQDYSLTGCSFIGNLETHRGAEIELAFDAFEDPARRIALQVRCVSHMPNGECMVGAAGSGLSIVEAMRNSND